MKFTKGAKLAIGAYVLAFASLVTYIGVEAATITTRAGKGSSLTHGELDANFKQNVAQKTTTYSVVEADNRRLIECNHATTPFTITLGDATTMIAADTGDFEVSFYNFGAAACTIQEAGSDTIDGGSTNIVLQQYESVTLKVDNAGTGWQSIARGLAGLTSTPTELNLLDGVTSTTAEINITDAGSTLTTPTVAGGDGFVMDDVDVGMVHVDIDNVDTYLSQTTKTLTNKTLTSPTITGNTTFSDGAYDFDIASHDGSNGLKLGGALVTLTAAQINKAVQNDGDTMTGLLTIDQDSNAVSLNIDSESTSVNVIKVDSATTSGTLLDLTGSSLDTGRLLYAYSNAGAGTRNLVEIVNDHVDATGTTALKIQQDSTGSAIVVAGGQIDLQHGQLKFPATQNASSDVNTLDDYEEGTFTPVIYDTSHSAESQTYTGTGQVGHYTKIGNLVHISGRVTLTSKGTMTTNLYLEGLPFTAKNVTNFFQAITIGSASGLNISAGQSIVLAISPNTQRAQINLWDATTGTTPLSESEATDNLDIIFGGTYISE